MNLICPHCARDLAERAQNFPRQPVPGDYLICLDCTNISFVLTDLTLCQTIEERLPKDIQDYINSYRHIKNTCKIVYAAPESIH